MEGIQYRGIARSLRPNKRLGQNFLMDKSVAKAEAEYGRGRRVVELGPGLGILTRELCEVASSVVAVEKDARVFDYLKGNLASGKLTLLHKDFFDASSGDLGDPEIMVSNVPYNLSSRVVIWLAEKGIPAVLCLQKEFVDRMLAKPGTREYSRLSVVTSLRFMVYRMMDIGPDSFYPAPKVSSAVVFLKPLERRIGTEAMRVLGLLMAHKKKTLRNAVVDSRAGLGLLADSAREIGDSLSMRDERLFKLEPESILDAADEVGRRAAALRRRT